MKPRESTNKAGHAALSNPKTISELTKDLDYPFFLKIQGTLQYSPFWVSLLFLWKGAE